MAKRKNQKDALSQLAQQSCEPFDPTSLTHEQWEEMKAVDIRTVDKSTLVDLQDVEIDTTLPYQQRMVSFLKQIKNPYCFRVGDVAVKVKYKESGPTFEENFVAMLKRMMG
jgi:hypothetical protein